VEREERVRNAQALYEANQKEIARLQGFVDRFGAKTMGASMAQSRLKTIEKLESKSPEAPRVDDGPPPVLRLPNPPRGSKRLLELKDIVLAWTGSTTEKDGDGEVSAAPPSPIIRNCNLIIERGMRIAVRGPNGAGEL
jgi:ATP-binding cassette subfamily F protein 3